MCGWGRPSSSSHCERFTSSDRPAQTLGQDAPTPSAPFRPFARISGGDRDHPHFAATACILPPRCSSLPAAPSPLPRARTRNAAAPARTQAQRVRARLGVDQPQGRAAESGTRAKQERPSPRLSLSSPSPPYLSSPTRVGTGTSCPSCRVGSTSSRLDRYWSAPRSGRDPGCVHTEAASRRVDSNATCAPLRPTTAHVASHPPRLHPETRV
ncbi:hypothetical protein C8R43DRAFT_1116656 [Mycena crocata]|nr:hypothetical protein C8R43DRAFT_1116656 [Mycena crocata]